MPSAAYEYSTVTHTRVCLGTLNHTKGPDQSHATGINDKNQLVGYSGSGYDVHAFLYESGKMTDLNNAIAPGTGWLLTRASAINNKGEILGQGMYYGRREWFLLVPPGVAE